MTAQQLRAWRARLGLTQVEAAARLGISERQYIRIERGDGGITDTVALLARAVEAGFRAA